MTQTSHSRQKPWDERAASRDDTDGVRGEHRSARGRKPRRSQLPIFLLTGTLLAAAGSGAGVLIFPDRMAEFLREPEWMKPSAAWSIIFPEWSPAARSGVAKADIVPAAAPVQVDAARFAAQAAVVPTVDKPIAQAPAVSAKAAGRDLPWLPDQAKPAEAPAAEPLQTASSTSAARPEAAAAASVPRPSPPAPLTEEIIDLMKRAGGHVQMGDIAGARLLLERAAAGREPNALMALAETYDPAMLARWGARGLKGDLKKARELYQAAAESGLAEARTRVLAVR